MTNNFTTFQTIINNIFQNLIVEGIITVYHILIFIQIFYKYYRAICRIIEVLAKHKLFLYLISSRLNT